MDDVKRCTYSYYDRTAYCHMCDITCKRCDGYVEKCEYYVNPYGCDNAPKED